MRGLRFRNASWAVRATLLAMVALESHTQAAAGSATAFLPLPACSAVGTPGSHRATCVRISGMRSVGGPVSGRGLGSRNPFLAAPELRGGRTVGGAALSAQKKEFTEEELDRQLQKDPNYHKLVSHPPFCFRSRAAPLGIDLIGCSALRRPCVQQSRRARGVYHPGGNPGANLKSISHRCHPILVAFVWELID